MFLYCEWPAMEFPSNRLAAYSQALRRHATVSLTPY
jgi:hypothetical protein